MTDRELMQQALGALEKLRVGLLTMQKHAESYGESWARAYVKEYRDMLPGAAEQQFRALNAMQHRLSDVAEGVIEGFDAIVALRQRLEQPEQEPFAWVDESAIRWLADRKGKTSAHCTTQLSAARSCEQPMPIYTAPQRREWVGLTDEEKSELWEISRAALPRYATYAILVETKLKEKNI